MGIETIGEAWNLSWELYVRCLYDGREGKLFTPPFFLVFGSRRASQPNPA